MAVQYHNKRNILDKKEQELENTKETSKFKSFLNSVLADILLFTAALVTMIIMLVIIYIMFGQSKLKALVANIVMQSIKGVEATDMSDMLCICKTQWYIMGMLIIITLGILYLVTNKIRKSSIFKALCIQYPFVHIYKLCRVAGSIHLFRIREKLNPENVKFKKNWIWDALEIDWSNISITLNENEVDLPSSVIIPFKERYRARRLLRKHPLLFFIMLKQGKTWFSLVPKPRNLSVTNDNN